jgi:hypothetical protein
VRDHAIDYLSADLLRYYRRVDERCLPRRLNLAAISKTLIARVGPALMAQVKLASVICRLDKEQDRRRICGSVPPLLLGD